MRKLILSNFQAPGDIVMLTAAVRDLHRCYPGQFVTDVRTTCPALWENNPYITPLEIKGDNVENIYCHYPLVHRSNEVQKHFIYGFIEFLNERLKLEIEPTEMKGDIHLTDNERALPPTFAEATVGKPPKRQDMAYWLIVSGGKYDFTIKWWEVKRYQQVVDYFKGRICFVQVGEDKHHHPALNNVIDLRGKTNLRELIQLMYHAQGVVTPVSLLMHLAAASSPPPLRWRGESGHYSFEKTKPCVVIAGGREPVYWEKYEGHEFLHTIGKLPCCEKGGCWKSRVKPLGDGNKNDKPENLCVDVVGDLPRCMDMITAEDVIQRIELYLKNQNYDKHETVVAGGADSEMGE